LKNFFFCGKSFCIKQSIPCILCFHKSSSSNWRTAAIGEQQQQQLARTRVGIILRPRTEKPTGGGGDDDDDLVFRRRKKEVVAKNAGPTAITPLFLSACLPDDSFL